MCCLRLSKMRVLLSLLHSPYTRLCWQLAAEPQTTATAVLLHAGMTLMMKDRHRRVSFAWADSARGRLGGGAGGLAADAARHKRLPQWCMRGGAGTGGRNLLIHHPLSHVRLPPASCISDAPANLIRAFDFALAARRRRCNNYLRERSSHVAAANRLC